MTKLNWIFYKQKTPSDQLKKVNNCDLYFNWREKEEKLSNKKWEGKLWKWEHVCSSFSQIKEKLNYILTNE